MMQIPNHSNQYARSNLHHFKSIKRTLLMMLSLLALSIPAQSLELVSSDIRHQKPLNHTHVFSGFGCEGKNQSPQLSWFGAPENTKSFAITAYDPDAPTGSGWWHWLVFDLPVNVSSLKRDAGNPANPKLPMHARQGKSDYGQIGFGGACPPKGRSPHHYEFTVYALDVDKLEVPEDASAAYIGYMIQHHLIDQAQLVATFGR